MYLGLTDVTESTGPVWLAVLVGVAVALEGVLAAAMGAAGQGNAAVAKMALPKIFDNVDINPKSKL